MSAITAIKTQVSIVAVAEQFMTLKRVGSRYKGTCPFHSEKSPSFVIYANTNTFKCYGCGLQGDQINLYGRFNGINNKEAMKRLAEAYSVDGSREYKPSTYEVERAISKKRTILRLQIGTWLFELEDLYFRIDSPELDSAFYQEFGRLEYWLANVDDVNAFTLDKMCEVMPKYFAGLYEKFWGKEGSLDEQAV